jgi:hypothetical protein
LARDAAIIDEYDGLPLYEKLRDFLRNKVKLLVANAVDDEPYVSSGISTVLYYGKEVAGGMELIRSILPRSATGLLAVFAPSSIHGMSRITEHKLKVKVKKLNGNYPLWIGLDRWLAKGNQVLHRDHMGRGSRRLPRGDLRFQYRYGKCYAFRQKRRQGDRCRHKPRDRRSCLL